MCHKDVYDGCLPHLFVVCYERAWPQQSRKQMKRSLPWNDDGNINQVNLVSSDDSDTENPHHDPQPLQQQHLFFSSDTSSIKPKSTEDSVLEMAKIYQDFMMNFPIPTHRGSLIPFNSWMELGTSLKQLYAQPLHYLTYKLLEQWDRDRFETENDLDPLDTIIHPLKAEATIWLLEEVHRHVVSYRRVADIWLQDPMYHAFVDPLCPRL